MGFCNSLWLGGGAFVGLGLRHIHQCFLQLILQSSAGGDKPTAEVVQFGWAFGQESFNLDSPLGNFVVYALNVCRVDAPARVEFKVASRDCRQVMSCMTKKCPKPGTVSSVDRTTSAASSIPYAESMAFRPSLL